MDYLRDLAGVRARVDSMAVGQEGLRTGLTSLESGLRGLEAKLIESTGSVKDSVLRDFAEARRTLEVIRAELEARKQLERDLQESSRRIEAVIAGGRSRGRAGENILAEAFKQFPPHIVETNFKVNGHPVEYALVLVDGRRVPVDSKWAIIGGSVVICLSQIQAALVKLGYIQSRTKVKVEAEEQPSE